MKCAKIWIFALCLLVIMGTGCTRQLPNDTTKEPIPLSESELDYFNSDEFFNGDYLNIRNQFLSSTYDEPSKINLFELFYTGTGFEETMTDDELSAVIEKSGIGGSIEDLPCMCEKNSRSNIDRILKEHMGITLDETVKAGLENFIYIAEYDSYYHFHGDTNYRSDIIFSNGEREGNLIRLYYDDIFFSDGKKVLTLKESTESYLFISNKIS